MKDLLKKAKNKLALAVVSGTLAVSGGNVASAADISVNAEMEKEAEINSTAKLVTSRISFVSNENCSACKKVSCSEHAEKNKSTTKKIVAMVNIPVTVYNGPYANLFESWKWKAIDDKYEQNKETKEKRSHDWKITYVTNKNGTHNKYKVCRGCGLKKFVLKEKHDFSDYRAINKDLEKSKCADGCGATKIRKHPDFEKVSKTNKDGTHRIYDVCISCGIKNLVVSKERHKFISYKFVNKSLEKSKCADGCGATKTRKHPGFEKVSKTNKDGTHRIYDACISCNLKNLVVSKEKHKFISYEFLNENQEQSMCEDNCGAKKRRDHSFLEPIIEYMSNKNGTHAKKTTEPCGTCDYENTDLVLDEKCEYSDWKYNPETGKDESSCPKCGDTKQKEHQNNSGGGGGSVVNPTETPTVTPTASPTETVTPTPNPTETITPSPTESITPSPTETVTPSPTPTEKPEHQHSLKDEEVIVGEETLDGVCKRTLEKCTDPNCPDKYSKVKKEEGHDFEVLSTTDTYEVVQCNNCLFYTTRKITPSLTPTPTESVTPSPTETVTPSPTPTEKPEHQHTLKDEEITVGEEKLDGVCKQLIEKCTDPNCPDNYSKVKKEIGHDFEILFAGDDYNAVQCNHCNYYTIDPKTNTALLESFYNEYYQVGEESLAYKELSDLPEDKKARGKVYTKKIA